MVGKLKVENPHLNEILKTLTIFITFGGWTNANEEYEYFWKKMSQNKIKKMIQKYYNFSEIEFEGSSNGFGVGRIEIKCWDIKIKKKDDNLVRELQIYIDKT